MRLRARAREHSILFDTYYLGDRNHGDTSGCTVVDNKRLWLRCRNGETGKVQARNQDLSFLWNTNNEYKYNRDTERKRANEKERE